MENTADKNNKIRYKGISSFTLHILAMIFMTCDHLWATIIPGNNWLTWVGRLTFPIYAFLLVEGYFHTNDLKKYFKRLIIFAVISEIPFNFMYGGSLFYPFHQNVLWTLLIGLFCISKIDKIRKKEIKNDVRNNIKKYFKFILKCTGIICLGYLTALLGMTDYYGNGILTIILFYFLRGNKWWQKVGQVIGLYIINWQLIKGQCIPIMIGNKEFEFMVQGIAILAMIPMLLYKGKQGLHNKVIQYLFYIYYPLHMIILYIISSVI